MEKRSRLIDRNMQTLDNEMKQLLTEKMQSSFKAVLFTPYQFEKFNGVIPNQIKYKNDLTLIKPAAKF